MTRSRPSSGGFAPMPGASTAAPTKTKTAKQQGEDIYNNARFKEMRAANPDAPEEEIIDYLRSRGEI